MRNASRKGVRKLLDLNGRHVIALGERDGIQGPAIEEVVKSAGAADVTSFTQCFV